MSTKLQQIRQEKGLSQAELSARSGVSKRLLQDYEQGHKPLNHARAITVFLLSRVLGCTMEDLIEMENVQDPEKKFAEM